MASKPMSLHTLMNGRLNQEFLVNVKELVDYLEPGESGKITITITVKRQDETNTITLKADQKVTLPSRSLAGAGHFNGPALFVNYDTAAVNQEPLEFDEQREEPEEEFIFREEAG